MEVQILVSQHGIEIVEVRVAGAVWGSFPNIDEAIDAASMSMVPPHMVNSAEEANRAILATSVFAALTAHHSALGLQAATLRRCCSL